MFRQLKSKYNSKKTIVDNIKFDSEFESKIYLFLKDYENLEIIELQPKYELQPAFRDIRAGLLTSGKSATVMAINHIADFKIKYKGVEIVIDAKGMETSEYKIKYKMVLFKYPDLNYKIIKSKKQLKSVLESM